MSLFARVFALLLACSLAPLFAVLAWVLRSDDALRDNARAFHAQAVRQAALLVEHFAADLNRELAFAAELERLPAGARADQLRLIQAASVNPRFLLLSLVGPEGKEYHRIAVESLFGPDYADRSADPVVRGADATGRVSFGAVELKGEVPVLPLAYPLPGGRCLYAAYSLERLWRRLGEQRVGLSGRVIATDGGGTPLPGMAPPEGLGSVAEPLGEGTEAIDRGRWIGAQLASGTFPWRLASFQPREEAFLRSGSFHLKLIGGVVLIGLVMVLVSASATQRLTAPLEALIAGAGRAAGGRFEEPVPEQGWGRLRDLARVFNAMMGKLKEIQELHLDRVLSEKAKVETMVKTMPEGILLANLRGELEYINAPAIEALQLSAASARAKGASLHEFISQNQFRGALQRILGKKPGSDTIAVRRGAETRYFKSQVALSTVGASQEAAVLVVLQDITAEHELERLKEELFHCIVHDLRNPMSTIVGFLDLGERKGAWTEEGKRYVAVMKRSVDNLLQLIDDILQVAKLESGQVPLKLASVLPADVLEGARAVFSIKAENEKKALRVKPVPRDLVLEGDRELLERLVMNLVGNALKFTPPGGSVTIEARRAESATGQAVEFLVSDTGPGIPKEQAQAIFEKFKQLEGEQKKAGFGLGLSICKRIVEMHGGTIWVESEVGKGTTFLFRLPVRQAAAA
ncbi:MAG: hypothetical protein HY554_03435 [Elusimicrobia bacterium]|nr:hypothetical protein [Elusimicrobiota bacterium]